MIRKFYILTMLFLTAAAFFAAGSAIAQTPVITAFEPQKASYGEIVTINGSGFAPKANLKVTFGSAVAKITESNSTTIKVTVPAGAAYAPVTVTNLPPASGLSAQSSQPFLLSFGGRENGEAMFGGYQKYGSAAPRQLYDVCSCDLDGDGKNDLVGSNQNGTSVTAYLNSSTPGQINMSAPASISTGAKTSYMSCSDLNGDGKADLVFTGYGADAANIIILKNTSNATGIISFAAPVYLPASPNILSKPVIRDLDGDGKPEIIVTNQTDNRIFIFKNTGSNGNLSFDPSFLSFTVSAETGPTTLGLRIKDVNNDGKADITASQLYGNKVYFLINKGTAGVIDFAPAIEASVPSGITNHELEDIDGDGKKDLITTEHFNNKINILLNNSTDGALSFAAAYPLDISEVRKDLTEYKMRPMGLELGDLNGDKKPDILTGSNSKPDAYGFINTSTPGNLSFSTVLFTDILLSTGKFTNVAIRDMDGDAIPDVIAGELETGHFYTFRNQTCIFPAINPSGTVNVCSGSSIILSTVQSPGTDPGTGGGTPRISYQWFEGNSMIGTGNTLEVFRAGSYYVKMTSVEGCDATSAPVTVNLFNESMATPVFAPVGAACAGQPLTLSVSPAVEGASYTWTNNAGFSSTTTSNTLTIAEANPELHAGIYKVVVTKNCQAEAQSAPVTIHPNIQASIAIDGNTTFCQGESRVLSAGGGFVSYEWFLNGSPATNGRAANFTAVEGGSYTVKVTNANGCQAESQPVQLDVSGSLTAAFEATAVACLNQPVQFTNTSVWATGKGVRYVWDFGDGTQSSAQSPTHTYTQPGSNINVSLHIQYEGSNCSSTVSHNLTVTETPAIGIETAGPAEFCAGDSVKVQLSGEIADAKWSNGGNGTFTYATQGGQLQAEVLTTAGCTTTKSIELTVLSPPVFEVTADKTEIGRGESAYLNVFGGVSYIWEPSEGLDDPTIPNPVASPAKTTTYTVRGTGENGCTASAEITISVDNSFKADAPELFIPATDQSWKVSNIENYPEVSLTIINKFGKQVFKAAPYTNDWNGTDKGSMLSDGVYYYIFKDPSGNIVKTGSITLVR